MISPNKIIDVPPIGPGHKHNNGRDKNTNSVNKYQMEYRMGSNSELNEKLHTS